MMMMTIQEWGAINVKVKVGIANIGELMVVMENGVNIVKNLFQEVYIFAHVVIFVKVKVAIDSIQKKSAQADFFVIILPSLSAKT